MTLKWTNFPSWMSYLTKYVTRETELCKVLNRILGVTYYPAGWKILLVIYLHFLKQHYSGCFSEVLNFVIGEKKFRGVSVILLVSYGEGVGGFGRLDVSSIEYDFLNSCLPCLASVCSAAAR